MNTVYTVLGILAIIRLITIIFEIKWSIKESKKEQERQEMLLNAFIQGDLM